MDMKILFLSEDYPNTECPHSACFVNERLKIYRRNGIRADVFAILERPSFPLRFFRLLKGTFSHASHVDKIFYDGTEFKLIYFNYSLSDRLFRSGEYIVNMCNALLESADIGDYDLIVTSFVYPLGIVASELSRSNNVPYVLIAHGSDIHEIPLESDSIKNKITECLENATAAIFVSHNLLEDSKTLGYIGANAKVITNGVNHSIFRAMDKKTAKNMIGIEADKKCVGFVGSLKQIKRADKLVDIFKDVKSIYGDNLTFLVIGDGELKCEIRKNAKSERIDLIMKGNIPQNELFKYMSAMDVMILPSRNEGWGCVIIEANACGTPVVGSDRGGIPEALGDGGIIVKDGDDFEERFASAIVELIRNPLDSEILARRTEAFAWDSTVQKEIELFSDIVMT
jgi:glycosyltransferase involved in cell wall biosynthesis